MPDDPEEIERKRIAQENAERLAKETAGNNPQAQDAAARRTVAQDAAKAGQARIQNQYNKRRDNTSWENLKKSIAEKYTEAKAGNGFVGGFLDDNKSKRTKDLLAGNTGSQYEKNEAQNKLNQAKSAYEQAKSNAKGSTDWASLCDGLSAILEARYKLCVAQGMSSADIYFTINPIVTATKGIGDLLDKPFVLKNWLASQEYFSPDPENGLQEANPEKTADPAATPTPPAGTKRKRETGDVEEDAAAAPDDTSRNTMG